MVITKYRLLLPGGEGMVHWRELGLIDNHLEDTLAISDDNIPST